MTIFLLVFIALVGGAPQGGTRAFPTKEMCEANIKPIVEEFAKHKLEGSSVSCVEIKLGVLS